MSGTDFSAVVVNYRTPDDLSAFLRSFADQPPAGTWELTVVNVSPSSADRQVATEWAERMTLRIVDHDTNVGYARACNYAALDTKGDTIAFFNADVRLTPGALETCHQALLAHDDWGVLGPRQIDDNGRFTHAGIFGTNTAPAHRAWQNRDQGQYRDIQEAVTVSGAAYFIKRTVWEELTDCPTYQALHPGAGAFLPTQHYYEETWVSYHARAHGWKVMYFGEATVIHRWHKASPVGGHADQQMAPSRTLFRKACDAHAIEHD